VGGIHFAGEYAAGALSGLMEGALQSGAMAAAQIRGVRSLHV
jgi:monoamine oxidase